MSLDYIDTKYINLLSGQLEHFKRKNDNLWNFRCPYCGDSQKDKTKARGYVFQKEGSYIYKCHNCGQGANLSNLVKYVNPQLHKEYVLEKFKGGKQANTGVTNTYFKPKPKVEKKELKGLKRISQLRHDHPAKKWVENRQIPTDQHYRLYYAPKFYEFASQFKEFKTGHDEPRLIIPFLDVDGNLIAFQGRAFGKSELRYITIKVDENAPKIFGLEQIDRTKTVYITEGPLDSLFLDNAVAMAGSVVDQKTIDRIGAEDLVFVFDNEPRSKEIINLMRKRIDDGFKIMIWNDHNNCKDINDMILSGMSKVEIQKIINENTHFGLSAKTRLSAWKKI